jgi:hypothetical protein
MHRGITISVVFPLPVKMRVRLPYHLMATCYLECVAADKNLIGICVK